MIQGNVSKHISTHGINCLKTDCRKMVTNDSKERSKQISVSRKSNLNGIARK